MSTRPETPLLDTVNTPEDLRKLDKSQLRQLSDELRAEVIDAVGQTGGHLGSGLGVVELTAAIHYVFDTPQDKLVWDVGHQCYPHKILTGRRDRIRTLRQGGGLSGFTKRSESEYDPFGAAHSSTSISAALGFAMANKMQDRPGRGIAVIGDGAMSAGMAYEAMNNAEQACIQRLIVILNDNDMSIAPPVGAVGLSGADGVLQANISACAPWRRKSRRSSAAACGADSPRAEEYARGMATGGTLFEEAGLLLRRPDRWPQSRAPDSGAGECPRQRTGPRADPRRHAEGQGLCPGREQRRQVSRRGQVRRGHRRAEEVESPRPPIRTCSARR